MKRASTSMAIGALLSGSMLCLTGSGPGPDQTAPRVTAAASEARAPVDVDQEPATDWRGHVQLLAQSGGREADALDIARKPRTHRIAVPARRPRHAPHGLVRQLSPDLIERALAVAKDIDPEMFDQLSTLQADRPVEFQKRMVGSRRSLIALAELRERDPDLYAVKLDELRNDIRVRRVAADLREALAKGETGQATRLEDQLRILVQIQVAFSIKAKGDVLCRLEEHLETLRAELNAEAESFEQTVQERMQRLMHPQEGGGPATEKPAADADRIDRAG